MKFSVTIPAYKSKYLKKTIESVLNQSYNNFELIIVDDASPEDIKSVVSEFDDNRIRYFRNEKNCGAINVVDNWNICLSYAVGDYVICMGDDDCLLPSCLENYVSLIKSYPDSKVFHALTEIIDENDNVIEKLELRPEFESALTFLHRRIVIGCRQFIGDFLFHTLTLREMGGFYKLPLAWGSDDITAFRAACVSGIANTQQYSFQYRENRRSITSTGNELLKLEAKVMEESWYLSAVNKDLIINNEDQHLFDEVHEKLPWYFDNERERLVLYMFRSDLYSFWNVLRNSKLLHLKRRKILRLFVRTLKCYFL